MIYFMLAKCTNSIFGLVLENPAESRSTNDRVSDGHWSSIIDMLMKQMPYCADKVKDRFTIDRIGDKHGERPRQLLL